MKNPRLLCSLLLLTTVNLGAQINATAPPHDTDYAVVSRGPHSSVWERTTYSRLPSGDWVTNLNHYVETATGLNHWDTNTGQFQPSSDVIEPITGGAAALNGQHKVRFAVDLATAGAIGLQTPDGQQLSMHLLGLCYSDQSSGKSVWIAEVTNSIGQFIGSNQVWYGNAFSGVSGSVSYVNTLQGLEQNVVLEAQPAPPEAYGLSSATTVLQAITEFVSPPAPIITTSSAGGTPALPGDETLQFGTIQFARGSAFLMGSQSGGVTVSKQWVTQDGRWFLVEQVPIAQIAGQLDSLPAAQAASIKPRRNSVLNVVSNKRLWPAGFVTEGNKGNKGRELGMKAGKMPAPLSNAGGTPVLPGKRADREIGAPGFVLDYVTFNTSQTNVVFQGDTTYYLSGSVSLYGTNTTFEGGTVIKYTNREDVVLTVDSPVSWLSSAYRPIIMTAKDDNSVGDAISGSTGNPTNYYAYTALSLTNSTGPQYFRIAYASYAISYAGSSTLNLTNGQIINCGDGVVASSTSQLNMENLLFANVQDDCVGPGTGTIDAQNTTFAFSGNLNPSSDAQFFLTNCIFADVTNEGRIHFNQWAQGQNNGFYNSFFGSTTGGNPITTTVFPFQSVGAGSFYLTNGCAFLNAGTTNIDPVLLAALAQKTTCPPILYSNVVCSTNLVLNQQAQRDFGNNQDLGYHYDPIDYLVDNFWVTNATLAVSNGAVLAGYNDEDVIVTDGGSIISMGTPLLPNWFTRYSCVQEEPVLLGTTNNTPTTINPYHANNAPSGLFRFTKFSCPAGGGDHLIHEESNWAYSNLWVQDCEFWSGGNDFSGFNNTFAVLKNNLFARSTISTVSGTYTNNSLAVSNNLFWNMNFVVRPGQNSNSWFFFNNDFDNCSIGGLGVQLPVNGYNAYLVNTNRLKPTNAFDIVMTNDIAYETGPLGTFYQPTNSILINAGSCTGGGAGLYHYTTTTNEVVEGFSEVDIGYHYVALDPNGNPIDTNGDGIPDYLEDSNGDGLFDAGDLADWLISPYNGLSRTNGLTVFTPLN